MENRRTENTEIERYTAKEESLIKLIHEMGFGELRIYVSDGQPVRVEELRKSIKL